MRVISSESPPAYNPLNNTEEELNRASAINSQLQLRQLMLGDSVSEALQVCYALQIIHQQKGIIRSIASGSTPSKVDNKLDRDQVILAAYLRQLNAAKK